jgi:hypothetical protein
MIETYNHMAMNTPGKSIRHEDCIREPLEKERERTDENYPVG